VPRDDFQRARNRDISKRAKLDYVTFGRATHERIQDDLPERIPERDPNDLHRVAPNLVAARKKKKKRLAKTPRGRVKITDWLNWLRQKIRQKNPRLAEKIPEFTKMPSRGDKGPILLLIGYALPDLRREEHGFMRDLVRCIGEAGIQELHKFQSNANKTVSQNASAILALVSKAGQSIRQSATGNNVGNPAPKALVGVHPTAPHVKSAGGNEVAPKLANGPAARQMSSVPLLSRPKQTTSRTGLVASHLRQDAAVPHAAKYSVDLLAKQLMTPDVTLRLDAIARLSRHGLYAESALPLLRQFTRNRNFRIRNAAKLAVQQIESAVRQTEGR